jgi:hypothetical protein
MNITDKGKLPEIVEDKLKELKDKHENQKD